MQSGNGIVTYADATEKLKARTRSFALRIITVCRFLPKSVEGRIIGGQIIRSGTGAAANYRAACRARSTKEFLAKIGIVLEESDETAFWLDLITAANLIKAARLQPLLIEANELTAIFGAAYWTTKQKLETDRQRKIKMKKSPNK
jgi:four helix bundle protein